MVFYTVLGCGVVVGMAMIKDASGTVKLVSAIITVRGLTWLCHRMVASINKDNADIINFCGWSIVGGSVVKILINAKGGLQPVVDLCGRLGEVLSKVYGVLEKMDMYADKLIFWN